MTDDAAGQGPAFSEGLGPVVPKRWYCLSRLGLATLCRDDDDAQTVAAESFVLYPQHGPYRVAQMVDAGEVERAVAAERERIKAAVTRCTLLAENCEGDGPEVDSARKSLACVILAAINGYEAPAPAGAQQGLFGA